MTHSYTRQFSGAKVSLSDDTTECFFIEDIARGLAMMNRYNGQTFKPYSVAEHSIHVASRLPPRLQMIGLLHDASEAYLIDMPKPHKEHLPDYMACEEKLQNRIWRSFGFSPEKVHQEYEVVKLVDNYMLKLEGPYLLPYGEEDFGPKNPEVENLIHLLKWDIAMQLFLTVYKNLRDGIPLEGPLSRKDINLILEEQ